MKIKTWYLLTMYGNIAFTLMLVVFVFVSAFEGYETFDEQLWVAFHRTLIILAGQISWNITMHSIPKLVPIPKSPERKE